MTAILIGLLFIIILLRGLLHLRRLRESSLEEELPSDKITVIIGIYLMLSKACIQYYRDYGTYPERITGDSNSLVEAGYLKGEPLAGMTKSLPRFSIVTAENTGTALCLANTKRALASDILVRIREMASPLVFVDVRASQFHPLTLPIANESVNLCLMLPLDPTKTAGQSEQKIA
ncbi:MAG: hypothetical protein HQL88_01305 [Magnetococcales bacterium]|nr:hypothetical protein [Magnetococcales bacterium]